jgi:hypothetical protein
MFIEKATKGSCGKLGAFDERSDGTEIVKTRYDDQPDRGTGIRKVVEAVQAVRWCVR